MRGRSSGWLDLTAGIQPEVEGALQVLLAGRTAEEMALGVVWHGACVDLVATGMASQIYGRWGLALAASSPCGG